ncbi:phage tail protein [Leuconostoc gelidum subsp. gasicomitatum]|uniref:phage tail protein n=1 Tax=Leuconostoc gasicomitatum TaxID=115778 RepID=UPI001CC4E5CA|nr:phage tail protein [Leuconostoc gasicomitatum]MBZ5995348.1 phage tail protein [Leuconostoc gasicomitatum]
MTRNIVFIKQAIGDETPVAVYNLSITESLNELSTLTFSFDSEGQNSVAAQMMAPQTRVLVPETNQWFRLSSINPVPLGKTFAYSVSAVHVGTDLHDKYVDKRLTNTQSLDSCMKFITNGTDFKYVIHDTFKNYSFSDGFGGDFSDSLLMNTLKENFGFEFYFDNLTIHIYKQLGNIDQFVFVDGYNATKISWTEDYSNIRTSIKGLGKQNDNGSYAASAEFRSPNADIWGVKQAATIQDDRFTDGGSLLEYIKSQLQDYPIIQYTMERAAFEHGAKLSEFNSVKIGNSGLLKDRFGIDVDTRIVGMTYFPQDPKQSDTLTFGNKIFDYAHNLALQRAARKTNENIGKSVAQLTSDVGSMMNNGVWYVWQ